MTKLQTEAQCKAALNQNPQNVKAHRRLSEIHAAKGDLPSALWAAILATLITPDDSWTRINLCNLLGSMSGYKLPAEILPILQSCAEDPAIETQNLASAVDAIWAGDADIRAVTERLETLEPGSAEFERKLSSKFAARLAGDRLLITVLREALLITPVLEKCFTLLRRHALAMFEAKGTLILGGQGALLLSALAQHCFASGYAWRELDGERERVIELCQRFSENPDWRAALILSGWRTLHDLDRIEALNLEGAPTPVRQALDGQLSEAARIRDLVSSVAGLGEITDETSLSVAAQYETFPYPKWHHFGQTQLADFWLTAKSRFPKANIRKGGSAPLRALVAGAGTGRSSASLRQSFRNIHITGVDLSRTSLAYAKMRCEELSIDDIDFLHGDILDLKNSAMTFDFIDCTGVLHHMSNPLDGLNALKATLAPNALMRLALYSELGRQSVVKAREFVTTGGFPDTREGVRAARAAIQDLGPDHPVGRLAAVLDFQSLDGLHDLIFNVQELRFTPKRISDLLDAAGMEFLGFDLTDPSTANQYRSAYPADSAMTDLENWQAFESKHPQTFEKMYTFWCRARPA